ncbi:DUF6339 family protein [Intrasporangium sp.]|uniref:DUF6339 family protein n=1 Tax=Intrasporangium sp. TaxID=1925024 RepID=UPI003365975C
MLDAMCLTEKAVRDIRLHSEEAESPSAFLESVDEVLRNSDNLLQLPFPTGGLPDLVVVDSSREVAEVANAQALYQALGAMPRVAASDPRLWNYLALGPMREYMNARWSLEGTRNWRGRLADRWLLNRATMGSLIRHGVARLWWLAELTYDASQERPLSAGSRNEWAYLEAALLKEDRVMAVFDRDFGSIPGVRFALLEHLTALGDRATQSTVRSMAKEITLLNGYRDLCVQSHLQLLETIRELTPATD